MCQLDNFVWWGIFKLLLRMDFKSLYTKHSELSCSLFCVAGWLTGNSETLCLTRLYKSVQKKTKTHSVSKSNALLLYCKLMISHAVWKYCSLIKTDLSQHITKHHTKVFTSQEYSFRKRSSVYSTLQKHSPIHNWAKWRNIISIHTWLMRMTVYS